MKASFSRMAVIGPAFALVLIGVASVAFAWGSTSGGHAAVPPAGPPAAASAHPTLIPGNPRLGGPVAQPAVFGTVASKTATTIVVTTTAGNTVTVNVSADTTYSVRGVAAASLADVAVGNRIAAQGTLNADGSLDATTVQTVAAGQPGFGGGRRGFGGGEGGRGGLPVPAPSATALGPST
jgi:Domain of unknown function (DUF5666)